MKFADMTIDQIQQLICELKRQIPDLHEVALRTCTPSEFSKGRGPISLWGSWKTDSDLTKCAHGIYAGGDDDGDVGELVQRFMEDYGRAVESSLKHKASKIGDLLSEIELEIPTPITGEDMAAIAAPAKEAA